MPSLHLKAATCFTLLAFSLICSSGCVGPEFAANPARAYSPAKYREQRALVLRPVPTDQATKRKDQFDLKFSHEVQNDAHKDDLRISNGDPISVVVSDVYLPHETDGSDAARDVAVLLDIETSGERKLESYAVWYERGVHPGQRLGFTSLLAYSDRAWNSRHQPYFRIRVIDVSQERNEETRAALSGLSEAVGSLASFIPHPAIPGAAAAIRTAGLVFSNRQNVSILDFTPQFYASEFVNEAKQSDLAIFSRGMWMVVGREPEVDEKFWNEPLSLHLKTGEILDRNGFAQKVPYVRLTVSTFDAAVPTVVLDRSKALFDLLGGKQVATKGVVDALNRQLISAVRTYQAHSDFVNVKSNEAFERLIQEARANDLTAEDRDFLAVVLRRVSGQFAMSVDDIERWWRTVGKTSGQIDPNSGRWKPRTL